MRRGNSCLVIRKRHFRRWQPRGEQQGSKTLCFWKAQGNGARTFQITRLSDHKKRSLLEGSRVQRAARARRVHLLSFLGPLRSLRPSRTLAKGGQLANQTAILRSSNCRCGAVRVSGRRFCWPAYSRRPLRGGGGTVLTGHRSEEHTSEVQSLRHLVCRLLL